MDIQTRLRGCRRARLVHPAAMALIVTTLQPKLRWCGFSSYRYHADSAKEARETIDEIASGKKTLDELLREV